MALTRRISFTRFDRWGRNLGRIAYTAATHEEGLDGTDELKITCEGDFAKGDRIVWADAQGAVHEHIVDEMERVHDDEGRPYTSLTCINSVAELWDDYIEDKRPSGSAAVALASILAATRWEVGTCDLEASASHTFYHLSAREALGELLDAWGGELETAIETDGATVTHRYVGIRAARGNQQSPKRFTWTKDITSIKRKTASDNPKSRIYGYGKGVETDGGGYGRRLTFGDVNGGKDYVEDADATAVWGHPDGNGGTLPAVGVYVNEQCEDAAQLLAEAKDYLEAAKTPQVSYEADVIDLYAFGRAWEGVSLGDSCAVVDKGFSDEGIRLKGRVSRLKRDLVTNDTTVTFGNLADALTDMWSSVTQQLKSASNSRAGYDAAAGASVSWLNKLMSALNQAFNAVGTYKVESFERGVIYSNVALNEETGTPLRSTAGMWAVNINGMGIRLAASLTSAGEWDWRTFITGASVNADCINAGTMRADRIRAGLLTDEKENNYWDLTTGEFKLSPGAKYGSSGSTVDGAIKETAEGLLSDYDESLNQQAVFNRLTNNGATQGIYMKNGKVYINAAYMATGTISDAHGYNSWNLETGALKTSRMTADGITATGTFRCGYSTYYTILNAAGQLAGYRTTGSGSSAERVGYIDYTAAMREVSTGNVYYGIQLQAQGSVRISSPIVSASASSDVSKTTTYGKTETVTQPIVSEVHDNGNGTVGWHYGKFKMQMINGLVTSYSTVGTS